MDQIHRQQTPQYKKEEIFLMVEEVRYQSVIELIDSKIKITIMMENQTPFKWSNDFTIEQLYKLNGVFIACENLEDAFEGLSNFLKLKDISIEFTDKIMILMINLIHIFKNCSMKIKLPQAELNSSEAFVQVNTKILALENQVNNLTQTIEQNSINYNNTLEEREREINQLRNQLTSLQQEQQEQQSQFLQSQQPRARFSQILFEDELPLIQRWINNNNHNNNLVRNVTLQSIYRATTDGFQLSRLYQNCANRTLVVVVIQTTLNRRFGFYSEQQIRIANWQAQNPNNTFLFSLDSQNKLSSNEQNCLYPIYADAGRIILGNTNDNVLYDNSNMNRNSVNACGTYGRNDGVVGWGYLAGTYEFITKEIEAFQVIIN